MARGPATTAPSTGTGDVIEMRPSAASSGPNGAMPLGSGPLPSTAAPEAAQGNSGGQVAGALATRIVGLLREHTGRGPTKAKALISADLVVVSLGDCLTTGERRLAATGDGELVGRTRDALLRGVGDEASTIVETLTGRQVSAYLTARGTDDDLAVLVFVLAPPG